MDPVRIKTAGYLISCLSVLLLGACAFPGAKDHAWMVPCLIAGMASSIAGMFLRWLSYRIEEKAKGRP